MKLIDFEEIFSKIHASMGIDKSEQVDFSWNNVEVGNDWTDILVTKGIDISVGDPDFVYGDDGLFFKGQRVVVYIRDQSVRNIDPYEFVLEEAQFTYKLHLKHCKTLQQMMEAGRYDKYVVSRNTDEMLPVNFVLADNSVIPAVRKVHVCKNCLKELNYMNYANSYQARKNEIYNSFTLKEFFDLIGEGNEKRFLSIPLRDAKSAPPNVYPKDWAVISANMKTLNQYKCAECNKIITDARDIHVHHKNGVKNDTSISNLEVLCESCHKKKHPSW